MSLPPLNPDKSASGIIVDPRTLERVVPQSRRKDGSVRKEQRVRPGFTPQEDVGRFRSARQQASDATSASKPVIPGSNRPAPQISSSATRSASSLNPAEGNPFAQEQREKTKAQLKNEKRREKRREKVALSWDEEEDGDDGDEDMQEAFEAADAEAEKKQQKAGAGTQQSQKGRTESQGAEQSFPPIDGNGGVPEESVVDNLKTQEEQDEEPSSTVAALEPAPPGPSGASFETSGETKPTPPTTTSSSPAPAAPQTSSSPANAGAEVGKKPSLLADRKAEVASTQKPHPIQGGRKGPIGLAHPPSIEQDKPKAPQQPSRADTDTWRKQPKPQQQQQRQQQQQSSSSGKGKPTQNKPRNPSQSQSKATPATTPAPRERREVKVREGGHNDVSSLANRVKNLVLANTVGNAPREKMSRTATPTGSTASASSEGKPTTAA
ncbi:hypothetical protein IAT40_007448 [Kwoniella sp. CBS 6097]